MSRPALYVLPYGIEVVGEYPPKGDNRYWRVRVRPHPFFGGRVTSGGVCVRRSRAVMSSVLGRALLSSEHVHHKDEDKQNDNPENLEVITAGEHNRHHKSGTKHSAESKAKTSATLKTLYQEGKKIPHVRLGEKNSSAKLTPILVRYIRSSNRSARSIAKDLGVSKQSVLSARKSKTWRHIK